MEDDPEVVFFRQELEHRRSIASHSTGLRGGKEKGKVDADEEKVKHVEVGK